MSQNRIPFKYPDCKHERTHTIDWPDGSWVEECCDCGLSRNCWEQGESGWLMVDVDEAYEQTKAGVEAMLQQVKKKDR